MSFEVRTPSRGSPASYWNQARGDCWGTHFVTKKQKNASVTCMSLCSTRTEIYSPALLTLSFLYYEFMYLYIPNQSREIKKEKWGKLTKRGKKKVACILYFRHQHSALRLSYFNLIQMCWTRPSLRITSKTTPLGSIKYHNHLIILTTSTSQCQLSQVVSATTTEPHGFAFICSDFLTGLLRDPVYNTVAATPVAYQQKA